MTSPMDTDTARQGLFDDTPDEVGSVIERPEPVGSQAPQQAGHGHPSELEYIKVAGVLALLTFAEVAVYYVRSLGSLLVPILLVLMLSKFAMVLMWFMHLRFDNRLFRRLFFLSMGEALFVYTGVLTTFHVWTRHS